MSPTETSPAPNKQRVSGLILIALGGLFLLAQWVPLPWAGWMVLPALSLLFGVWGLLTRAPGLLVPSGILGGIALGTYLVNGPLTEASGTVQGGAFLLAFAAGWALVIGLSVLIGRAQWWPLIPGGILALIGGALLAGEAGQQAMELLGRAWPLALIGVGVWVLLRRKA